MTSTPSRAVAPADASAVPSVRGLRSWGAVLVAVAFTAVGAVIGVNNLADGQSLATSWPLRILFVVGVVLAALAVRRGAIFTAMVQPPLVLAVAIVVGGTLNSSKGLLFSGVDVVKSFPLMVVGTAAAILIGGIRMVAQPLRRSAAAARPQASAHA